MSLVLAYLCSGDKTPWGPIHFFSDDSIPTKTKHSFCLLSEIAPFFTGFGTDAKEVKIEINRLNGTVIDTPAVLSVDFLVGNNFEKNYALNATE